METATLKQVPSWAQPILQEARRRNVNINELINELMNFYTQQILTSGTQHTTVPKWQQRPISETIKNMMPRNRKEVSFKDNDEYEEYMTNSRYDYYESLS